MAEEMAAKMAAIIFANRLVGDNLPLEEDSAYDERIQSLRQREFPMLQGSPS